MHIVRTRLIILSVHSYINSFIDSLSDSHSKCVTNNYWWTDNLNFNGYQKFTIKVIDLVTSQELPMYLLINYFNSINQSELVVSKIEKYWYVVKIAVEKHPMI